MKSILYKINAFTLYIVTFCSVKLQVPLLYLSFFVLVSDRRSWRASNGAGTTSVAAANTDPWSLLRHRTTRCCAALHAACKPTCCVFGDVDSNLTPRSSGSSGGATNPTWVTSYTMSSKVRLRKECLFVCVCGGFVCSGYSFLEADNCLDSFHSVSMFVLRTGVFKNTLTADAHFFLPHLIRAPKRMLQDWPNFYYYTYFGYDDANNACSFYDKPV